jgi:hypothetical protein
MGRKEIPIDLDTVDNMLMAGCLGTEIAEKFKMHPDTLYNRIQSEYNMAFSAYSALKRSLGDALLKVKQFEKACEKDNTMMIWLGKVRLEQREPEMQRDTAPPNDLIIQKDNENMIIKAQLLQAQKRIEEMEKILVNQPQTRSEFFGIDA